MGQHLVAHGNHLAVVGKPAAERFLIWKDVAETVGGGVVDGGEAAADECVHRQRRGCRHPEDLGVDFGGRGHPYHQRHRRQGLDVAEKAMEQNAGAEHDAQASGEG